MTNEQWVDYIWRSVIDMYGQRWIKEEPEMSKVELLKELDPKKVEAWDKLHDKHKIYRCERCGAEWRCEYGDNKFGNLYANNGDSDILCQCCGFPTVKEVVFRGADGYTAVGGRFACDTARLSTDGTIHITKSS